MRSDSGSGGCCPSLRVEVDPWRDPDDGAHTVGAHRPRGGRARPGTGAGWTPTCCIASPRASRARSRRAGGRARGIRAQSASASSLVLVDVAALPVPVGPLGQHRRAARPSREEARAAAPAGRRVAEQVHAQRPGRRPRRHRDLVAEVEARAVALALEPRGPAARRAHPRHGRVVALRDATDVEHVGRAVGARVAAVGAELDGTAGLVDVQAVAGAEPDEALLGMPLPGERVAQVARDRRRARRSRGPRPRSARAGGARRAAVAERSSARPPEPRGRSRRAAAPHA